MLSIPLALDPNTFPTLDRYTGAPMPNPSRPVNYGQKVSTLVQEFDSGHQQRRVKAPPKATFDFSYNMLTLTQYKTLRDFFMMVMNVQSFMWTDPIEKTPYRVIFNMDTFVGSQKEHGPKGAYYSVDMKLLQSWG